MLQISDLNPLPRVIKITERSQTNQWWVNGVEYGKKENVAEFFRTLVREGYTCQSTPSCDIYTKE